MAKRSDLIIDRTKINQWGQEWLHLTIPGRPWVKKNGQMIKRMKGAKCSYCYQPTGRPFISPSYDFEKKYQLPSIKFIKSWMEDNNHLIIDDYVWTIYRFYMPTLMEPDLSNLLEAPQDSLTRAGFWTDDRLVKSVDRSRVLYDKDNPRTEVWVSKYKPGDEDRALIALFQAKKLKKIEKAAEDDPNAVRVDISSPLGSII